MLSKIKPKIGGLLKPLTEKISSIGIKPNHITALACIFGFFSAYFIIVKEIAIALVFLILSGFFDALDGALARNERLKTDFGGFLDSVLDRYVDASVILAAGIYSGHLFLSAIAVVGALLVSYTRARAENIIEKCDVGIAERGERTVILIIGLLFNYVFYALVIIAVLSHITAVHRIIYTYIQTKK